MPHEKKPNFQKLPIIISPHIVIRRKKQLCPYLNLCFSEIEKKMKFIDFKCIYHPELQIKCEKYIEFQNNPSIRKKEKNEENKCK